MTEKVTQKSFASNMDRQSLHIVRAKHGDLIDLIGALSEKLSAVKTDQEKEFLSAYRVHMLNVQLELKELTTKVAKAEEFLQDDSEVSKLEEECQWFRNETNRLQSHVHAMDQDMKQLRLRRTALNDQKRYLSDQLKQTMKRSRVLQTEIDMIDQRAEMEASESMQKKAQSQSHHTTSENPPQTIHFQSIAAEESVDETSGLGNRAYSENKIKLQSKNNVAKNKHTSSTPALRYKKPTMSAAKVQNLNQEENIRAALRSSNSRNGTGNGGSRGSVLGGDLNEPIDTLVQSNRKGRKNKEALYRCEPGSAEYYLRELEMLQNARSELEIKSEQYVIHVFNKILERKALVTAKTSRTSKSKLLSASIASGIADPSLVSAGTISDNENFSLAASHILNDTGHDPSGLTGLGLHYFTESDRFQCMCLFLSDPIVFASVVGELQNRIF